MVRNLFVYLLTIINQYIFFSSTSVPRMPASIIPTPVLLFRSVSGGSIAPVSLSFSLFAMPISATSFLIIMTWLVFGGADGGVGAWGGRGGGGEKRKRRRGCRSDEGWVGFFGEGVSEAFTPRLLIPLLKGFCSIMPDSFRK